MNKDDNKNRHFVLLIIDISKHGAKDMGYVKMAEPGFVNDVTARWPGFVPNKITNNARVQTLFAVLDYNNNIWYASLCPLYIILNIVKLEQTLDVWT